MQVQVFKVVPQLYSGDLKVVLSSNPLDEQVSLRHSADFAGNLADYEFEWRWATGAASAPATYAINMTQRIGEPGSTDNWLIVSDPGALQASEEQFSQAAAAVPFSIANPRSVTLRPASYTDAEIAAGYPGMMLRAESGVDFSGGVPGSIVFSAKTGTYDGFVLYVNSQAALAYNAPSPQFMLTQASSGLTDLGDSAVGGDDSLKQFSIPPAYFNVGENTVELALYTSADPEVPTALGFVLEAAEEIDLVDSAVTPGTEWQVPTSGDSNIALIGGSPLNPFGASSFILNDHWFTLRYKTKTESNNVVGPGVYSRWTPPQFVPGWIKRVLAAINPFNQRVTDLYNNAIDSDVSVITQGRHSLGR